jgi:hypothetical protein
MGQTLAVRAALPEPTVVVTMEENALEAFPSEHDPRPRRIATPAIDVPTLGRLVTASAVPVVTRARSGVTMRWPRLSWALRLGIAAILLAGAAGAAAIGMFARDAVDLRPPALLISRQ